MKENKILSKMTNTGRFKLLKKQRITYSFVKSK